MRSAQSRLGLVTSLGSACRGVGRCVNALPVPVTALKVGTCAAAGLAGAALLRSLFSRRPAPPAPAPQLSSSRKGSMVRLLLSESVVVLLPLLRRYVLGEGAPGSPQPGSLAERILKNGR